MAIVSTDMSHPLLVLLANLHLSTDRHVSSVFVHRTYIEVTGVTVGRGICTYGHRRNPEHSPSRRFRSNGGEWWRLTRRGDIVF
jgi:PII-like signaling protein